jgi:hypothetical protein
MGVLVVVVRDYTTAILRAASTGRMLSHPFDTAFSLLRANG